MPPCSDWPLRAPPHYLPVSFSSLRLRASFYFLQKIATYGEKKFFFLLKLKKGRMEKHYKRGEQSKANIPAPAADINQLPGNRQTSLKKMRKGKEMVVVVVGVVQSVVKIPWDVREEEVCVRVFACACGKAVVVVVVVVCTVGKGPWRYAHASGVFPNTGTWLSTNRLMRGRVGGFWRGGGVDAGFLFVKACR